mmetsp:Transcript_34441/g.75933  ORF Transcript_34441/g.75933 Transcript_34441/m.75933 type:complete len:213 (-) Transcript_34441:1949-2587(-)
MQQPSHNRPICYPTMSLLLLLHPSLSPPRSALQQVVVDHHVVGQAPHGRLELASPVPVLQHEGVRVPAMSGALHGRADLAGEGVGVVAHGVGLRLDVHAVYPGDGPVDKVDRPAPQCPHAVLHLARPHRQPDEACVHARPQGGHFRPDDCPGALCGRQHGRHHAPHLCLEGRLALPVQPLPCVEEGVEGERDELVVGVVVVVWVVDLHVEAV